MGQATTGTETCQQDMQAIADWGPVALVTLMPGLRRLERNRSRAAPLGEAPGCARAGCWG